MTERNRLLDYYLIPFKQYGMDGKGAIVRVPAITGQGKTHTVPQFIERVMTDPSVRNEALAGYHIKFIYMTPSKVSFPSAKDCRTFSKRAVRVYGYDDAEIEFFKRFHPETWESTNRDIHVSAIRQVIKPFLSECRQYVDEDVKEDEQQFPDEMVERVDALFSTYVKEYYNYYVYRKHHEDQDILDAYKEKYQKKRDKLRRYLKWFLEKFKLRTGMDNSQFFLDKTYAFIWALFPAAQFLNPEKDVFLMTSSKAFNPLSPVLDKRFNLFDVYDIYPDEDTFFVVFMDEADQTKGVFDGKRYDEGTRKYDQIAVFKQLSSIKRSGLTFSRRMYQLSKKNRDVRRCMRSILSLERNMYGKLDDFLTIYDWAMHSYRFSLPKGSKYVQSYGLPKVKRKGTDKLDIIEIPEARDSVGADAHNEIYAIDKEKPLSDRQFEFLPFHWDLMNISNYLVTCLGLIAINYLEIRKALAMADAADSDQGTVRIDSSNNLDSAISTVLCNLLGINPDNTRGSVDHSFEKGQLDLFTLVKEKLLEPRFTSRRTPLQVFRPASTEYYNHPLSLIEPSHTEYREQDDDFHKYQLTMSFENYLLHLVLPDKKKKCHFMVYLLSATIGYHTVLSNPSYEYMERMLPGIFYQPNPDIVSAVYQQYEESHRLDTPGEEVHIHIDVPDQCITEITSTNSRDQELQAGQTELKKMLDCARSVQYFREIGFHHPYKAAGALHSEFMSLLNDFTMDSWKISLIIAFLHTALAFRKHHIRSLLFFNTNSLYRYQDILKKMAAMYCLVNGVISSAEEYKSFQDEFYFFKVEHLNNTTKDEADFTKVLEHALDGKPIFIVTSYQSGGRGFNAQLICPYDQLDELACIGDDDEVKEFHQKINAIKKAGKSAYNTNACAWIHGSAEEREKFEDKVVFVDFQSVYLGQPTHIVPSYSDFEDETGAGDGLPQRKKKDEVTKVTMKGLDYAHLLYANGEIGSEELDTLCRYYLGLLIRNTVEFNKLESVKSEQLKVLNQALGRITRIRNRYRDIYLFLSVRIKQLPFYTVLEATPLGHNAYVDKIIAFQARESIGESDMPTPAQKSRKRIIRKNNELAALIYELVREFGLMHGVPRNEPQRVHAIYVFSYLHQHILEFGGGSDETTDLQIPDTEERQGGSFGDVYTETVTGEKINRRWYRRQEGSKNVRIIEVSDKVPDSVGDGWLECSAEALQLARFHECQLIGQAMDEHHIATTWEKTSFFIIPAMFEQVMKGSWGEFLLSVVIRHTLGWTPIALPDDFFEFFDIAVEEQPVLFDAKFMTFRSYQDFVESDEKRQHIIDKAKILAAHGYPCKGIVVANMRIPDPDDIKDIRMQPKLFQDGEIMLLSIPCLFKPDVTAALGDFIFKDAKTQIIHFMNTVEAKGEV